jgi:uncharacterized protein with FMN-binding domain
MGKAKVNPKKQNKYNNTIVFLALLILIGGAFGLRYILAVNKEHQAVRALVIEDQDLASVHDGTYLGDYTYGGFTYQVSVTIQNYRIKGIDILKNRSTRYAKMAEGVVDKVLAKGNVNVEVVSGATTTSKALLKAIEQAIFCNL